MKNKNILIGITFAISVIFVGLIIAKFIYPTYASEYALKGDFVPSIRTVLNENKWVSSYKVSTKNKVLTRTYTYKNQENVISDLKTYTNYLIQQEQFKVLRSYDLNDYSNTSIYLAKESHINTEYVIIVNIEYTSSSYKIIVSKKKGTLIE